MPQPPVTGSAVRAVPGIPNKDLTTESAAGSSQHCGTSAHLGCSYMSRMITCWVPTCVPCKAGAGRKPAAIIAMPVHRYWALVLGALQRYYWDHLLPAMQAKDTWKSSQQEIMELYM